MQVWGKSLEFWDNVSVWLMWIAAFTGGAAAFSGLAGAIISRQVSSVVQRDADERIASANALAATSNASAADANLRLQQLRNQVGPRQLRRQDFLEALRAVAPVPVQIVYLRDDPECFDVAQQVWRLLQDAGWPVTPPEPIVASGDAQPAPMDLDGQPAGITVVGRTNSEDEANAGEQRFLGRPWVRTPFTVLAYAFERALGKAATNLNGPHAPTAGTLRVVVAPR